MKRTIVRIDEERCNGCGACARACHEGAIAMVAGKARLIRDDYCDGLGDCLPACPTGAISFEEREAADYDEAAVAEHLAARAAGGAAPAPVTHHAGCPGAQARTLRPMAGVSGAFSAAGTSGMRAPAPLVGRPQPVSAPMPEWAGTSEADAMALGGPGVPGMVDPRSIAAQASAPSQLAQWPCQIKLVPVNAPYFQGADLLIAADCTAFAYASLHRDFMAGRVTLIGCPKLDAVDYADKLGAILRANDIRSVTLVRMEVPCCGGLAHAAERAVAASGKGIPLAVVTITCDGRLAS